MLKPLFFSLAFLLLMGNANAQSAWLSDASSEIAASQYYFTQQNNNYTAANEKNQLGFIIDPAGYSVKQVITPDVPKSFDLKFIIQSIQNETVPAGSYPQLTNPSKLVFNYPAYRIEYNNDAEGLRQNFVINYKKGDNGLNVKIKIESSLSYTVNYSNELVFTNAQGNIALKYDGLKVWDANGKLLPASMKINGDILTLAVNDTDAEYPVTIDPLNHASEWLTSSDGILPTLLTNLALQIDALYGYSMTALGDINNDGYDDVAVGAPGAINIVAATSFLQAGAVFVYYGSAGGLATTPSKVLRPNTPVAGALFGFSVASGDEVGNSLPDIVVGSPLETITVNIPAVIGNEDKDVTSGRIYIFNGQDMSAGNPPPFASINLGSGYFSQGLLGLLSNINNKNLFGYSVAVADDLNGDGKGDVIVGVPGYLGTPALSVRSGAAFVYYSNNLSTTSPVQLTTPNSSLLGVVTLPLLNTEGLLFGYSVDGVGDFNGDGYKDVVVGAPAGINLNSLGGIFGGKTLSGSAYVFNGNGSGINNTSSTRLEPSTTNLLGTGPNLFGYSVRGTRNASNARNGKILVGAPLGNTLSNVVSALTLKTGNIYLYKTPGTGVIEPDQTIASPRGTSLLSILTGRPIIVSSMFGASMDNTMDINCDGIADIIVGEPLSTGVGLIGVDAVGGAAMVLTGNADGTYNSSPFETFTTVTSMDLGINAASMLGNSVAGAGRVFGVGTSPRVMVGAPAKSLDFGTGLLNLGNTMSTLWSFSAGNNGLGKAYSFSVGSCSVLSLHERERLTRVIESSVVANNMKVMPNPVTASEFNIYLEKFTPGSYRMEMYSSLGQRIAFTRINVSGNKQIIPLSRKNYSSGVYSVNIYDNQNNLISVKRVVFN
jgi:hypothetical protein